jgi:TatD DNase family protein
MASMKTENNNLHKTVKSAPLLQQLENYIIVDVGANLTNKKFSRDLDSVLQRAKDSGTFDNHLQM